MNGYSKAHALIVSYELHTLGWKGFQDLCTTLLADIWGQTIEAFSDTRDGGRDAAFHGTWKSQGNQVFEGSFAAQCKFTAQPHGSIGAIDLAAELTKAARLADAGLADNYFLLTNYSLTGSSEESLRSQFLQIPGIKTFSAFGLERISQIIRESPRLRMLVPRIYGLGDLSQILDERAYVQAQELLSSIGDDLSKFVVTNAYRLSEKALAQHGFVLLIGEPACGKSTIAATLAMGAHDIWDCSILKIRNADEFLRHWNAIESRQLFWVDDAFGSTQYDAASVFAWNQAFPAVTSATHRGSKFIFTSRDYVFKYALGNLKQSSIPVLLESQVVIRVEELSMQEREQILYNHVRKGTQTVKWRSQVKPFLPAVAANLHFRPEVARRLGNPVFTRYLTLTHQTIARFVENPHDFVQDVIKTMDRSSFSALAMIFMRGGTLQSPISLDLTENRAVELLGASLAELRDGLNSLSGSMVVFRRQAGMSAWEFKHPTIRDAVADIIAKDPELLDIYLAGAPIEMLLHEVVCGDVQYAGAKVVVPHNRYDSLIDRLFRDVTKSGGLRNSLIRFLAARCDKDFLLAYVRTFPGLISGLEVDSYVIHQVEVDLLARMHELGILPEKERVRIVERFSDLAVETPDTGFLNSRLRPILETEELLEIVARTTTELLPHLDDVIRDWENNHDGLADPEEFFDDLRSSLDDLKSEYRSMGDRNSMRVISDAFRRIDSAIDTLRADTPQSSDESVYSQARTEPSPTVSRSVFEDVDS